MPVVWPSRWPASVDPSQALGYLLARQVPPGVLPEGLTLIRQAAGWVPAGGVEPIWAEVTSTTARSWMVAASEHAAQLGPPPGMSELLTLLGDGVMRTEGEARSVLEGAGAGEVADPRILLDFARWCGADLPFDVVPLGVRDGRRVKVYVREAADVARARAVADRTARRYGVISAGRAMQVLAADGIRIASGGDARWVRDVLGVSGDEHWWWPRRGVVTPLTRAMRRIQALGVRVPLEQVPDAVARTPSRRIPVMPGEWPVPAEAVRVWARGQDQWRLAGETELHPAGPGIVMHPHDRLIVAVLTGRELPWKALQQRLVARGMTSPAATAAIMYSPVLRRTRNGYVLLGPETQESQQGGGGVGSGVLRPNA